MEGIKFNENYNNKLNCEFFTTIRPKKEKYKVGEFFIMSCPGIQDFMAEIISVSEYPNLASFSELELANDTGLDDYDKIVKLFESFYSNFDGPWYLIVLKRFDKKCVKCIECGSEDLEIHNCGYSSFNRGVMLNAKIVTIQLALIYLGMILMKFLFKHGITEMTQGF